MTTRLSSSTRCLLKLAAFLIPTGLGVAALVYNHLTYKAQLEQNKAQLEQNEAMTNISQGVTRTADGITQLIKTFKPNSTKVEPLPTQKSAPQTKPNLDILPPKITKHSKPALPHTPARLYCADRIKLHGLVLPIRLAADPTVDNAIANIPPGSIVRGTDTKLICRRTWWYGRWRRACWREVTYKWKTGFVANAFLSTDLSNCQPEGGSPPSAMRNTRRNIG